MSELRIDVSELRRERQDLITELAEFLERETEAKVETAGDEVIVRGEVTSKKMFMRRLLKEFLQRVNVKGKVKKRKSDSDTLIIVKSKKPIFCDRSGLWKKELEESLQKGDEVMLFTLGEVKYQMLNYLNKRRDIEIVNMETRYMKKREKGTGLKVIIRSRRHPKPPSKQAF